MPPLCYAVSFIWILKSVILFERFLKLGLKIYTGRRGKHSRSFFKRKVEILVALEMRSKFGFCGLVGGHPAKSGMVAIRKQTAFLCAALP